MIVDYDILKECILSKKIKSLKNVHSVRGFERIEKKYKDIFSKINDFENIFCEFMDLYEKYKSENY